MMMLARGVLRLLTPEHDRVSVGPDVRRVSTAADLPRLSVSSEKPRDSGKQHK